MTRNLASVSNEFKLWLHAYTLILILRISSGIIDVYLKYIENAAESESFSFANMGHRKLTLNKEMEDFASFTLSLILNWQGLGSSKIYVECLFVCLSFRSPLIRGHEQAKLLTVLQDERTVSWALLLDTASVSFCTLELRAIWHAGVPFHTVPNSAHFIVRQDTRLCINRAMQTRKILIKRAFWHAARKPPCHFAHCLLFCVSFWRFSFFNSPFSLFFRGGSHLCQ